MRRARIVLTLVTLALVFCASGTVRASQSLTQTSGIGLLDYTGKPTFKVGDYVQYKVTNADQNGKVLDSYITTVMIAGEELWWGERCFWLEAWVGDGKVQRSISATLMSYSVFEDSLAEDRVQTYMRKIIADSDEGKINEVIASPGNPRLTSRPAPSQPHTVQRDTLGADTVQAPGGTLHALKVEMHQAWGKSGGRGDSTIYEELREDRTQWISGDIPLTHSALEETKATRTRRAWLIGRSTDAPPALLISSSVYTARVIGYGRGLKSLVLPPERARSFDDPPAVKRSAPAARPRTTSGGARRR
jgi:hypothetical protein